MNSDSLIPNVYNRFSSETLLIRQASLFSFLKWRPSSSTLRYSLIFSSNKSNFPFSSSLASRYFSSRSCFSLCFFSFSALIFKRFSSLIFSNLSCFDCISASQLCFSYHFSILDVLILNFLETSSKASSFDVVYQSN